MNNVKDLKESDMILLTYKGSEYDEKIINTSIIGMFKGNSINAEGKNTIVVQVIHDNAPKGSIVFESGRIINIEITRFKEHTSRRKGLTIIKKKNPGYIELRIL